MNAANASAAGGCLLFDFDGTLADTAPDMLAALNAWRAARGHPPAEPRARGLCSGGARALLEMSGWEGESFEDARADYLRRYEETAYKKTALFGGVAQLLAAIADCGFCWGIVTNKPRRYFSAIAEQMQLTKLGAAVMICGDDLSKAKPHPDPLLAAAKHCGMPPGNCAYVGDDIRDGRAAAAAGMKFAAVTWGYWRAEHWQADDTPPVELFAATPKALTAWLVFFSQRGKN